MGLDLKRTPNYSSANNEVFKIYRESESYFILLITNEFIKFYYPYIPMYGYLFERL